jgi:hypothetical protein
VTLPQSPRAPASRPLPTGGSWVVVADYDLSRAERTVAAVQECGTQVRIVSLPRRSMPRMPTL